MTTPSSPQSAEIVSGKRRILLHHVLFEDLGGGRWQMELNVGAQEDTMALMDIVRGGNGTLMLSINSGPVVGAQTRVRPLFQTILSQPMRYEFAWP